jgi:nicotinamidase/pyrazinamidase
MKQKFLIIVDPQLDFIEGGSLAIEGAEKAMKNLTQHLKHHGLDYDRIFVSLDTHHPTNLGFKMNWLGPGLDKIVPGQPFPKESIKSGEIYPRFKYTRDQDVATVLKQPEFICWPPHCLKSSKGHDIYPELENVLAQLKDKVTFMTKGEDDARDNYSIFHYGDRGLTRYGENFDLWDKRYDNPDIYIAGLALDYCVFETVKSLQEISQNGTYTLLVSMGASIREQEVVTRLYESLKRKVEIKL